MKKNLAFIMVLLLSCIIMTSCFNPKNGTDDENKGAKNEKELENEDKNKDDNNATEAENKENQNGDKDVNSEKVSLLDKFYAVCDEKKQPSALIDFIESQKNIPATSLKIMIFKLESKMLEYMPTLGKQAVVDVDQEQLKKLGGGEDILDDDFKDKKYDKFRKQLDVIFENGFCLQSSGGIYAPSINYKKLLSLASSAGEEVTDYLKIKELDLLHPYVNEGKLAISFNELAERILASENYIEKYKDNEAFNSLIADFQFKTVIYLTGTALSPISDSDGYILKDVMDSYSKYAANTDSHLGHITAAYLKYIREHNKKIDKNIYSTASELVSEETRAMSSMK